MLPATCYYNLLLAPERRRTRRRGLEQRSARAHEFASSDLLSPHEIERVLQQLFCPHPESGPALQQSFWSSHELRRAEQEPCPF